MPENTVKNESSNEENNTNGQISHQNETQVSLPWTNSFNCSYEMFVVIFKQLIITYRNK